MFFAKCYAESCDDIKYHQGKMDALGKEISLTERQIGKLEENVEEQKALLDKNIVSLLANNVELKETNSYHFFRKNTKS